MKTLLFLLLFPLLPALLSSCIGHHQIRGWIVRISSLVIALASLYCAWLFIGKDLQLFSLESPWIEKGVFAAEMLTALFLLYKCKDITRHEWWIPALILAQTGITLFCEFGLSVPKVEHALYIDSFSVIMALIIGIIGTLICVYSVQYMTSARVAPGSRERGAPMSVSWRPRSPAVR